MLEIKTSYQSGILNIELYGAFDSLTSPDFKQWLTDKSITGYHYFALNCRGLEYISSRGIGMLVELHNVLNEGQTRLMLYHVSNEVLNLLEFLKINRNLPIAETYKQVEETFNANPQKIKVPVAGIPVKKEAEKVTGLEDKDRQPSQQLPDHNDVASGTVQEAENSSHGATPSEGETISTDTREHEYIDLSSEKWTRHGNDLNKINIIYCPNCGEKLKVSKKGLYLCPDCRTKFNYPFQ